MPARIRHRVIAYRQTIVPWVRINRQEFIKKYPQKVTRAIAASYSEDKASELCKLALDNCTRHFEADSVIVCLKGFEEDNMKVFTELLESKNWHLIINRFWVYFNMEPELADYVVNKFTIETLCDNCDSSALKMIFNKLPFFKRHSYLKRMKNYLREKEEKDEQKTD